MASKKRKVVSIAVDADFFKNSFEPARIKAQKKLGLYTLSQANFTRMLSKSNLNLDIKLNEVVSDVRPKKNNRKKR